MNTQIETLYDVLILGGGPSGLTAAIYTARATLKTLVIGGAPSGGQLTLTSEVENFPGFPNGIQGLDLIQACKDQALKFGTVHVEENVTKVSGTFETGFSVETDGHNIYKGKSIIIATGASAKWLNIESEQRLRGKGVSACATCDGFFFKEKVTAVIGAGDAAMEDATFLTKFSPKVHVLVRGKKEEMKASKYMLNKALANPKIEFHYNTEVAEILGDASVDGLKVKNNITNEIITLPDVKGVFVAIGHSPNTKFLEGFLELGKFGYVVVTENTLSSVKGVFVAGDVADYRYRQAVSAAGLGCMAALDVEKFLASHEDK